MEKEEEKERALAKLKYKYLGQDLVEILTAPTPPDWILERQARGGRMVSYVPGFRFIERLNEVFGFLWSLDVLDEFELNGHIVAKMQLSIQIPSRTLIEEFPDGTKKTVKFEGLTIKKTQFGGSEIKKYKEDSSTHKKGDVVDLGDDYKAAATDGMKKCGTELGMFLDVYRQRGEGEETARVMKVQLEALYARGKDAGMEKEQVDEWVQKELDKPIEQADQMNIMTLIPKLIKIAREKQSAT